MLAKRVVTLACCVGALACKNLPDSEVAARVNGQPITKKEFEAEVDRNMARYRGQNHQLPPSIEARIKESVLRRMIDEKIMDLKAKELSVDIPDQELEAKFQEYKSRFRTDQAFNDYLTRSNNTAENMREDLKRNLLRDRVVEKLSGTVEVKDEEVKKYYDENKDRFLDKEQIRGSRILLRVAPDAKPAEKKAAKKKAAELRAKILKGADFAELAKTSSQGPEASRGGDLGWFTRGRMPPEFDNVAFALAANGLSDAVETKMGYELIKVWEKKPERQRPIEEVAENIKNSLLARERNDKRRDILRQLKEGAKIEQLLTFDTGAPGQPPMAAPGMPGMPPPGMTGGPGMPPGMAGGPGMPPGMPGRPMPPGGMGGMRPGMPGQPGMPPPNAPAPGGAPQAPPVGAGTPANGSPQ